MWQNRGVLSYGMKFTIAECKKCSKIFILCIYSTTDSVIPLPKTDRIRFDPQICQRWSIFSRSMVSFRKLQVKFFVYHSSLVTSVEKRIRTCAGLRLPSLVWTQLQVFRLLGQDGSGPDLNGAEVHAGSFHTDVDTWAPVRPLHQVAFACSTRETENITVTENKYKNLPRHSWLTAYRKLFCLG